jgi:hypothetical protein
MLAIMEEFMAKMKVHHEMIAKMRAGYEEMMAEMRAW